MSKNLAVDCVGGFLMIIACVAIIAIISGLGGLLYMVLWNYVIVALFPSLTLVSFWQGIGIMVITGIIKEVFTGGRNTKQLIELNKK